MSQLLEEHDELLAASNREMTLSTSAILGIFIGLALLCGLFFGFGYNLGRKSGATAALAAVPAEPAAAATPSSSASEAFDKFKPSAATPAKPPTSSSPDRRDEAESTAASAASSEPHANTPVAAHTEPALKSGPAASAAPRPGPATATTAATPALLPPPGETSATAGPAGTYFVQVAAVSHPEDASMLLGALRARGYTVAQRSESTDKLIHIQVGPFGSKPAAEAMRQRLQTDGYNAIIK